MKKVSFTINDIRSFSSNSQTFLRGLEYYNKNHVLDITSQEKYYQNIGENITEFCSNVKGGHSRQYDISIEIDDDGDLVDFNCNCDAFFNYAGCCKHIVATLFNIYYMYNSKPFTATHPTSIFKQPPAPQRNYQLEELINIFENKITTSIKTEYMDGTVSLNPILFIADKYSIGIEFTIGDKRNYVVKDAYALANNIKNTISVKYGKSLEFDHALGGFTKESQLIAKFLESECEIYKQLIAKTQGTYHSLTVTGRTFNIMPFSLDNFFDLFKNKTIECHGYNYKYSLITFVDKNPDVEFFIKQQDDKCYFTTNLDLSFCLSSKDYTYVIWNDTFYKCTNEFVDNVLPAVNKIIMQPSRKILLSQSHMGKFFSAVLPQISKYAKIISDIDIVERFKIEPLSASIYLDTDKNNYIYGDVVFNYGDTQIHPLTKSASDDDIARNLVEEAMILTLLENLGFIKSNSKFFMADESTIYEFLTSGINLLNNLCEVNISEEFKKISIRYPRSMTMGVKLKSNLIEIDIDALEFDPSELMDILSTYKKKKKYFRLKDGSFLNLDNDYFSTMEKLVDDLDISSKELESGLINIPKYRSLYLDSLIKNNNCVNATKEQSFREMIRNINESDETDFEPPKALRDILRNYQQTGYKWLKTLSNYSLGGILADDMGLGKTIQIISVLLSEKKSFSRPSIVVCPTSLVYNWKSEIEKFAPEISTIIISGNADYRKELIEDIKSYDLVFTSYDSVKRDVELYNDVFFRYCILDEAQYIKNSNTQNAKSVKLIKSDIRFALTGTPIENSLSDLWSIFDFIMPGFLLSYKKFKDKYEIPIIKDNNDDMLKRLHKQIQPFILRRIKKDVLKELPDKIETLAYAQMDIIQRKLYMAELLKFNEEFNQEVSQNGYDKSQIKILAMLTRLRQLCCHPSLYIENYRGDSAKLDLCMQILKNSLEAGHKVLIFSQFTSMLSIIENELKRLSTDYYLLTGATKSKDRLDLANKFNSDSTPVFLISLKAGGTGLNLTGADVVIHFDPWWNISAQNQATDRTHRIGQKNKVQVFKLIAKDTIEEKIEKLQQNKKSLADSVIKEGEIIINNLSKEEINSLFDLSVNSSH